MTSSPSPVDPSFLLIGPYDPKGGEYTFLAPPLGVWRLAGFLEHHGFRAEVFDPNLPPPGLTPEAALERKLRERAWTVVGCSTTGMTLRYDLALAHLARRVSPRALFLAGGMEATFKPDLLLRLGPFGLIVLGEGEKPLLELARRLRANEPIAELKGSAWLDEEGKLCRSFEQAMNAAELTAATALTPYDQMPYVDYWQKLERSYRVGELPFKAAREARLAEIRSVRLNTLNYCPMACTFCSSTNFLHAAQGSVAKLARLSADDCLILIEGIVAAQPGVRTVIFQDDIFVFVNDDRILPLCRGIQAAKEQGRLPKDLQFISTNRIDSMTEERLVAMRDAGFRVLGFGVESFSRDVLVEFNKARIYPHIEPALSRALELGLTPFLDIILTSPRSSLANLAETLDRAFEWIIKGCEVGMYPYVIPFSGAAMANDQSLEEHTISAEWRIKGTSIRWRQPTKILPVDPALRDMILEIESLFEEALAALEGQGAHLPSRVRSLLWITSAIEPLSRYGLPTPSSERVAAELDARLPSSLAAAWKRRSEELARVAS